MNATCTAAADWDIWGRKHAGPLSACGEPAMAVLTQACVHEHLIRVLLCATCAAEIQRVADAMICRRCENAEPSHECAVGIEIEWLEAAS